ncbi:MAG: TRAP transporter small permease [Rhodospirillales bacterium]|nr:TRAP transporter small permease [Rhodospirillales bacterium]
MRRLLSGFEWAVCGALLVSIVALLFIQVIARYGLGQSISWAEEMSRFGLLGLVYISAAMGAKKGTHIRITAHLKLLPPVPRIIVFALSDLIWLAFNVIVIYQSILLIDSMNERPLVSGALLLNMQYVFALIPLGFFLQSVRLIERWWRVVCHGGPILGSSEEISSPAKRGD